MCHEIIGLQKIFKMQLILSRKGLVCYGFTSPGIGCSMKRLVACFALAALSAAAVAADKPAPKARVTKASTRAPAISDFNKDGDPNLQSTAALVLDAKTGQTLFAKNADQVHPIASITKLMTAMVVLDSNDPFALEPGDILI